MAKKPELEKLFDDYFDSLVAGINLFEQTFSLEGVCDQIFGKSRLSGDKFNTEQDEKAAKDQVRASQAWQKLAGLYNYAIHGLLPESMDPTDLVIGGAEILSLLDSENHTSPGSWQPIVAQGDGRFALDDGEDLELQKLALLAGVDVRTVRNAISAGELKAEKVDSTVYVDNESARAWLNGRRAFTPTTIPTEYFEDIDSSMTPAQFGAYLKARREQLGLNTNATNVVVLHTSISNKSIADIESGLFRLPLDAVSPIADFYQIDRKKLLATVMHVFFKEELNSLRDLMYSAEGANNEES